MHFKRIKLAKRTLKSRTWNLYRFPVQIGTGLEERWVAAALVGRKRKKEYG